MIPAKPILAFALALALALPIAPPSAAAEGPALPKGVVAGPSIEGISEYTLANGLRVLLFPDPTKPTVTVNLTYAVGSVHENYGQTGMAHLLEHLLFKGTPTHNDISGEMKRRGITFNATFVALTSSIIVMFFLHQLQLAQERMVLDTETYLDQHLLRHMRSG